MFGFGRKVRPFPFAGEDATSSRSQQSSREARQALHRADWENKQIQSRSQQVADLSAQIEAELKRNGLVEAITKAMGREPT